MLLKHTHILQQTMNNTVSGKALKEELNNCYNDSVSQLLHVHKPCLLYCQRDSLLLNNVSGMLYGVCLCTGTTADVANSGWPLKHGHAWHQCGCCTLLAALLPIAGTRRIAANPQIL
jgi:hypothetical protein